MLNLNTHLLRILHYLTNRIFPISTVHHHKEARYSSLNAYC